MPEENKYDSVAHFNQLIGNDRPEEEESDEPDIKTPDENEDDDKAEPAKVADEGETEKPAETDWKAKAEEAERRAAEFEQQYKSVNGRVSSYQQKYEEAVAKLKSAPKPKIESLEKAREDLPEFAQAIEDALARQREELEASFNERLTPLQQEQERRAQDSQVNARKQAEDFLAARHPDWRDYDDLDQNKEFAGWLSNQASGIRAMYGAAEDTAANAAVLIDLYKQAKASQQPDAAASVSDSQSKLERASRSAIPATKGGSVGRAPTRESEFAAAMRRVEQRFK